ncbi:ABC transporter ATP-binding protein [Qiania dongpingensis]|uniref:ABC transporter ATP-binding protein n=1 Tax=Qiania dongpingensis TaxID=2763669 RepID=A0A7G9G6K7_9FIRM|nr:ABC transporter ATP-binding protein [Qiania dongpingensis]QNM06439.1 ABC transporter ATP-binding protein [Qiania dongpingensis]
MEISIEHLNQYYGKKQALRDVNLTISSGMFGLLGKNGAGKTTLMKVLSTLLKKSEGTVKVCGVPVEHAKEVRSMVGYLPQDFSMYGSMSAYEAMDYLGALSGLSKQERKERILPLLEKVNLDAQVKTKVKAMSGGMRRRLGIAQAILHDPKVLIVDEPTAGLDPEERVRFRNLLCETAQDRIVILSTHIVGDVEATCEHIGILDEGELIFNGTVGQLLSMTEGRVYSAEISKLELPKVQSMYPVTSMLAVGGSVTVRFISDVPPVFPAKLCRAGVEDAYLYLMHVEGGEL